MEALGLVYVLIIIAGAILLCLLVWAPMKLYSINKELQSLNAAFRKYAEDKRDADKTQTKLLAAIANALEPVVHTTKLDSEN